MCSHARSSGMKKSSIPSVQVFPFPANSPSRLLATLPLHLQPSSKTAAPFPSSRPRHPYLPQRLPRKTRQHKARPMNLAIIIPTQPFLLLHTPMPQRRLDIPVRVLAADHKPDLARGVGGDRGVGVFDGGEDFFAGGFEGCD